MGGHPIKRGTSVQAFPKTTETRITQQQVSAGATVVVSAMSVEKIFSELHDWTTWPEPPARPLLPGDPSRLRPAEVIPVPPESLVPWVPPADDVKQGQP